MHGQRGAFLGWLVGSVALAAVMGALAQGVVGAILSNPSLSKAMGITKQDAADGFLASTQVYLAIIACGYVVQALGLLRREEAAGRLEPVLAGALGRVRWLGAQVLVIITGLVVMVVASAIAFGVATAISTGDSGYVGTLLKSGLAYLPAELVIAVDQLELIYDRELELTSPSRDSNATPRAQKAHPARTIRAAAQAAPAPPHRVGVRKLKV